MTTTNPTPNPLLDDLAELEALAKEATPGEWRLGFESGVSCGLAERNPGYSCITAPHPPFAFGAAIGCTETQANAAYIAFANPARLLRIVAAVRDLTAELERLESAWEGAHAMAVVRAELLADASYIRELHLANERDAAQRADRER